MTNPNNRFWPRVVAAAGYALEYAETNSNKDADWNRIPGGASNSVGDEPGDTTQVKGFDGASKTAGVPGVPDLVYTIDAWAPNHFTTDDLDAARRAASSLFFRGVVPGKVLMGPTDGNVKAAIAADGAVTWAGGDPDPEILEIGVSIQIGSDLHRLREKAANGAIKVDKVSQAVPAAVYSIVAPKLILGPFEGVPTSFGSIQLDQGGFLGTSLTVTPKKDNFRWTPKAP